MYVIRSEDTSYCAIIINQFCFEFLGQSVDP